MNSLIEMYNEILQTVKSISEKIHKIEQEIEEKRKEIDNDIPARIKRIEEQLVKIDEYVLTIKGLQEVAKKNLESQNVLTIEAPPGYRVNLNRLRKWAMLIDPMSSNDPYAQRVLAVAKCDECFLEQKRIEFTEKLTELKAKGDNDASCRINELEEQAGELRDELNRFAESSYLYEFFKKVIDENNRYWHQESPSRYENYDSKTKNFALGAYALPLPFGNAYKEQFKNQMGKFFDVENGRVLIPAEISLDTEFVITISCAPTKDKTLDKAIQNLILNVIDNSIAGMQKVYVIDGVRFNSRSIGTLRQLEDTFALAQIPRNQEQITATLEKIVSSFADIDEILGNCDSVKLYNDGVAEEGKKIPMTTVVLYGWSSAYEGRNRELLTRIMTNYERYGVSFVIVTYKKEEKVNAEFHNNLPEYATHNAIHIRMFQNDTTICMPDEEPQKFVWYVLNDVLSEEYVSSLKSYKVEKSVIGSEYIKRYSLDEYPEYTKGKKSIVLPFGIDAKDQVHSIAFDNENFAAYLMGASGSGKSTLLHTLITGILRNYHPDDVELWLADFKMSEFAQYMNPLPPHIKYILLDESSELVYDLLDKLTEKMMERQRFFMQNRKLKKVENVTSTYMPIIFVILDEFSIMSQAVAESPSYKLKLQNLLAKGRALGIKFIFASQDFTKGISGLSATAKDQIQSRIAMKNTYSEINDTLELSMNMKTEQVKNWMEAIPPHYALMKYRDGEHVRVKRINVMYFKDNDGNAYEPQSRFIKLLNENMKAVNDYNEGNMDEYVYKDPVIVDGNSYDAFDSAILKEKIQTLFSNKDFSGDEIFVYLGTPRLMIKYKEIVLTPEARQNILLICDSRERTCGTAIVTSALKSFEMQSKKTVIWAYERNKILKTAIGSVWRGFDIISDIEDICIQIKNIKDMIQNDIIEEETLIVLLGFENICADFEFMPSENNSIKKESETVQKMISNIKVDISQEDEESSKVREIFNASIMSEEDEEIDIQKYLNMSGDDIFKMFSTQYEKESAVTEENVEKNIVKQNVVEENNEVELQEERIYNAKDDLKYILQHGSRKGIHFLLYLNSYSDLKITGLKEELFRHRLSFAISPDDSRMLFGNSSASSLSEHICMYSDMIEKFSFRPYLHRELSWDGWLVDDNGQPVNSFFQ